MTEVNLFEVASRTKLRFASVVGQLCVEDLWTIPLSAVSGKVSLDSIAIELNKELKGTEESFVTNTKKDEVVKLKFELVKHIIGVRVEENRKKTEEAQRKAKLANIDDLITQKQNEQLANLSLEELQKLKDSI